ncbi:uncharacterized protein LOC131847457 [Achroia grisella]|uniref:uncharacterized protein LOC131847457 n=1 Tax=Achroia grisella TaxID=688607 RepID=UPI0027D2C66B|nr:uncharacterized protein LOC131847457 [Achroia grisella]
MSKYCFSDIELKIISDQIERRAKYRQEFLKQRTDPCKHAQQAGYVFDPALQRFISMKTCQYDHFQANTGTVSKAILFLAPFFIYGYLVWENRTKFEKDCRSGKLVYRDRKFKFQ